jgi:hypothetical protein
MVVTVLPSHAGEGATEATKLWCDVDVESCFQWHCRVMLAMVLLR